MDEKTLRARRAELEARLREINHELVNHSLAFCRGEPAAIETVARLRTEQDELELADYMLSLAKGELGHIEREGKRQAEAAVKANPLHGLDVPALLNQLRAMIDAEPTKADVYRQRLQPTEIARYAPTSRSRAKSHST
jgi:hypothetical protein